MNQALQGYRPQVELEAQVMKDAISQWEKEVIADLKRQDDSELAQESVRDRAECLRVLVYGKKRSIEKVREDIADLFSDNRSSVWLSTVHRAKGLEAKRVFILEPGKMPHPRAKKDWEIEQE